MRTVGGFLDSVEENTFSVLYRCRWDRELAEEITHELMRCLSSSDITEQLRRSLSALHRIGMPAGGAIGEVIPLVWHQSDIVSRTAILTLASIGLTKPEEVVPVLIAAVKVDGLSKDAMFALICFGRSAANSVDMFREAFKSPKAKMRCLALRGVASVASLEIARSFTLLGLADRSKQVRDYSQRLKARLSKTKAEP